MTFVENFQMTETLFEAAIDARNRGCDEIAKEIGTVLLSWIFKSGRYQTGWGILERGLCGLAAFALMGRDGEVFGLRTAVAAHLSGESAPVQEIRERAARRIFERAASLYRQGSWYVPYRYGDRSKPTTRNCVLFWRRSLACCRQGPTHEAANGQGVHKDNRSVSALAPK